MELITDRYKNEISGNLRCYDRIVIKGTLPHICYAQGMAGFLSYRKVLLFDYTKYMNPIREAIRENAEQLAKKNDLDIIFVRSSKARKEDIVKANIDENKTGLVCILSAMEACPSYQPWHDKVSRKTFLKGTQSKCLHYYFYFNDPDLGLGYVRVPTWAPFQLQIYFNGHNLLAANLDKKKIEYSMIDNAFDYVDDYKKAQRLSDNMDISKIHKKLDWFAKIYCPIHTQFDEKYHWSTMQVEYSTDIIFKDQKDLQNIYPELVATAIHTVKPDHIATFLGQKLTGHYQGEMGNNYHVRIEGCCIKHAMGAVSIKMYDKFSKVLRIETTVNDVTQFKHYRSVEHRDGTTSQQQAPVKKNIYSLAPLTEILTASNRRYLEFISAIEDNNVGNHRLKKITNDKKENERNYKGLNFFKKEDVKIIETITRGEYNINGFRAKDLKKRMPAFSPSQISRILKRLRVHGIIKKIRNSYKYYVTVLGKTAISTLMKMKNIVIIPHLNQKVA